MKNGDKLKEITLEAFTYVYVVKDTNTLNGEITQVDYFADYNEAEYFFESLLEILEVLGYTEE